MIEKLGFTHISAQMMRLITPVCKVEWRVEFQFKLN